MNNTKQAFFAAVIFTLALPFNGCSGSDTSYNPHYESCKDVVDLSAFQENFGSYELSKKIPFKHSNGYTFYMEVVQIDKGADDFCNMRHNIVLESTYPIYTINLYTSRNSTSLGPSKNDQDTIGVSFGQYRFTLVNPEADTSNVDTLVINNKIYADVAIVKGRKIKQTEVIPAYISSYDEEEETIESDAKLYYQTRKGILKIEMEDNTYIAINEKETK